MNDLTMQTYMQELITRLYWYYAENQDYQLRAVPFFQAVRLIK
jgi:hypothetical protein